MLVVQFGVGGGTTITHLTWNCTPHKIVPHIHFIYIPRVSDLPFPHDCFRALKTLGTETPANPDVSFLIYCTDNQEYFSTYALRTMKMIRRVPTLMGLVSFMFPCLLLAAFRSESDCKYTSYRYVKGLSAGDVLTGSTVTKINITFISRSLFSAPYKSSARDMCLRNWPTSCLAIMFFVKESVELFGKKGFLFTSGFKLNWMRAVMTWQPSLQTRASACWNIPMGLEGDATVGRKMCCQNRHSRKPSDFLSRLGSEIWL